MLIHTLPIPNSLTLTAEPLTPTAFSPFGSVLANPAPERRPHNTPASALPPGYGAVSANQGTAIQYRALAPPLRNLYDQAPSRKPATPRTTMFVCGARQLLPDSEENQDQDRAKDKRSHKQKQKLKHAKHSRDGGNSNDSSNSSSSSRSSRSNSSPKAGLFPLQILERHPYTTQTFIPLGATPSARYLVIVAPSLPADTATNATDAAKALPIPTGKDLPGRGLPDLTGVRAFVATGSQAVTYGAGTWHAPMAALGGAGSAIDFVVVQFANDEPVEDCQEVALEGERGKGETEKEKEDEARILVRVPLRRARTSKL